MVGRQSMLPTKSSATLHRLSRLDLDLLVISETLGPLGMSFHCVSSEVGSGQMSCWNSIRKLRKEGLVVIPDNPSGLGGITLRGRSVLRKMRDES